MPKLAKPLTNTQVKSAKVKTKPYTLADGGGMYLEITTAGSKIWRMSYRQPNGKNTRLTFGTYPEVSLLDARRLRMDSSKLRAAGSVPAQAKRIDKLNEASATANTFEAVAREWHANKAESWKERTAAKQLGSKGAAPFQFIVTTTSAPPDELRNDAYVVLELEPRAEESLLFKKRLMPKLPWTT